MSAIIFCDGFDTYTTALDKWDNFFTNGTNAVSAGIIAGSGRGGAGAFFSPPATQQAGNPNIGSFLAKNIGTQSTLYVGFALFWNPAGQLLDMQILRFLDGATVQISLWINPSGVFYFTKNNSSTVIGTMASTPFPSNSYHYVEVQVTISSTVGVLQLKVDQTSYLNITGANTQQSVNASCNTVQLGSLAVSAPSNIGSVYIDDVYFDTSGFNGDVRINGQLPTGNGTTQNFSPIEATWLANTITRLQTTIFDGTNLQRATAITGDFKTGGSAPTWNVTLSGTTTDNHVTWTNLGSVAHWKLVSETDPDSDSSYVQSNTVNDIERFTFPAIVGSNIATVIIWAFGRKDDGGFRTIQGNIKSGATVGNTGTDISPGTNYAYLMLQSLTDPNTGAAWTLSGVNAAEFGVKITN